MPIIAKLTQVNKLAVISSQVNEVDMPIPKYIEKNF